MMQRLLPILTAPFLAALFVASALLCLAQPASAQNMVESGGYVVHYNALSTMQLTPEIARNYRITRSPNRAFMNISVQRRGEDGLPFAVPAEVEASATNLTGQRRNLSVREVRDGDALYYIAETGISNRETLVFDVSVLPEGAATPTTLRFQQQFFTD